MAVNLQRNFCFIFLVCVLGSISGTAAKVDSDEQTILQTFQEQRLAYEFFAYVQNLSDFLVDNSPKMHRYQRDDVQCKEQLKLLTQDLFKRKFWALKMIDAWGSLPSGLLIGNLIDLGNFDECVEINKPLPDSHNIQGKYCLVTFPVGQLMHESAFRDFIQFQVGTCMPAVCSVDYMNRILRKFINAVLQINISTDLALVNENSCSVREPVPLSNVTKATIVILTTLAALSLLCAFWDYLCSSSDTQLHPLVKALSLRTNAYQLFRVVDHSENPNVIPSLNGIRCLSIIWVIFAHSFLMHISIPNINSYDMLDWVQTPFAMLISQGFFSVDSFFFMAGLLLVIIAMREMDKTSGRLNVPLMYLFRYLRLTPALGIAIMVCMSEKYISDGPLWEARGSGGFDMCSETWWATILYVQNYVYPMTMCLSHSWYLAVDTQLYILSPIMLYALWKWGKRAIVGIVVLMLLLWACLFSIIMIHDYSLFYKRFDNIAETMKKIYFPTHVRAFPWLIGAMFGYFLHVTKDKKFKLSKFVILLGWVICFLLLAICMFSLLPKSQLEASPLTTLQEALFVSLTRIAWPLALCWIVFAGKHGFGGPVESFLGSPLWQPLAKISYCMYIFHVVIVNTHGARLKTNLRFSTYDLMLRFWPDFGFTILLSSAMYLLVEAPIAGVISATMKQKKPKKSQSTETILSAETSAKAETSLESKMG